MDPHTNPRRMQRANCILTPSNERVPASLFEPGGLEAVYLAAISTLDVRFRSTPTVHLINALRI